jgi:hypothetical protein
MGRQTCEQAKRLILIDRADRRASIVQPTAVLGEEAPSRCWRPDRLTRSASLGDGESLDELAGDFGDDLEVLVEMEDGEPSQLGGGSDQKIRD